MSGRSLNLNLARHIFDGASNNSWGIVDERNKICGVLYNKVMKFIVASLIW